MTLGIFAWVSGNIQFSNYLDIFYIPNVGEIVVFIAAFVGALVGFWIIGILLAIISIVTLKIR